MPNQNNTNQSTKYMHNLRVKLHSRVQNDNWNDNSI